MEKRNAAPESRSFPKGDQTLDSFKEGDDDNIPDCFRCCVCLDLLYKPIALACGHLSCFWCVNKSMDVIQSHCPICRHPYNHFPGICLLLHFLLLKVEPVQYKRREVQVLEEERKADCFSPQFDNQLPTKVILSSNQQNSAIGSPHSSIEFCCQVDLQSDTCSSEKKNPGDAADSLDHETLFHGNVGSVSAVSCLECDATNSNVASKENKLSENGWVNGIYKQVTIADALCAACKQLLFRPTVLNCGHVYCESCIATTGDGSPRCQVCGSLHPGGFPKVCLVFDQFLQENLPEEYALRKEAFHLKQVPCLQGGSSACAEKAEKQTQKKSSPSSPMRNAHYGIGCDSCGLCPIIGERYKCMDCVESIGFDLCGDCYKTRSKLPGRFNQNHTPDHVFKLVESNMFLDSIRWLVVVQSEDGSDAAILSDDVPEDQENNTESTS